MIKKNPDGDTVSTLLGVVADLLRGDRHSRRTIAESTGKSLPTADRWIDQVEESLPNVRRVREGKTTWLVYDGRHLPSRSAATGACVAASLGALFEGSQQERNLKDARDFVLRERGETYADLDRKFVLAPRGGESALPEAGGTLDEVIGALLENHRLRFSYTHNDGQADTLTIEPLSLVVFDHQFYVLATRDEGKAFYPYRFARMAHVKKLDEEFVYPAKGEYDPKSILAQAFGIHLYDAGPVEDVEVILSGAWANFALTHRWHPTQRATKLDGDRVSVTLQVRLCRELETWVLSFGEHALVVRPERLAKRIAERLKRAAATYAKSPGARPSIAKAERNVAERRLKRGAK
jgi:predicted DNA-binding transcriptional regulator YafY